MPKKLQGAPDALKHLLPNEAEEPVVVGTQAYSMAPLTSAQAEKVAADISTMASIAATEILEVVENIKSQGEQNLQSSSIFILAMKKGVTELIQCGCIQNIVKVALDLTDEEIAAVTIKQLHHIFAVLWGQNFDFSQAPESTSKNFARLLETVGFGRKDNDLYQWADVTLKLLLDTQIGSPEERIDLVLHQAMMCGLLEEPPEDIRKRIIRENASTRTSQSTSGSPESTSTENDSSSAPSPETDVEEGTTQSASEQPATVTDTPNGES